MASNVKVTSGTGVLTVGGLGSSAGWGYTSPYPGPMVQSVAQPHFDVQQYNREIEQRAVDAMVRRINDVLDGKDWGPGSGAGTWEPLRKRLYALAKIERCFHVKTD